nr:immunoglobulin heavy chain junction region [Macaca mulatta]MOV43521.1 immunoglobulin heavy chain junction region [Macaca mulatta]
CTTLGMASATSDPLNVW